MNKNLHVAAWEQCSTVNGPGKRFVLWLQGCPFRCPGCFNPAYLTETEGSWHSVDHLVDQILSIPELEGITFSGGEPMAQAHGLACLSKELKTHGLSVFSYSGYTLAELNAKRDVEIDRLLSLIDILVDGRFENTQAANLLWRGSRNQMVHFLSDRYRDWESQIHIPQREVELIVGSESFTSTGILQQTILKRMNELLPGDEPL